MKQKAELLISPGMEQGKAMFGTLETWLIWTLRDRQMHVTGTTNAPRTALMHLDALDWSRELKDVFDVSHRRQMTSIRACNVDIGTLTKTA